MKPNIPRAHGFTLIEMMVVLAVIGIVSALILPEMKGTYHDALLRSTSRKLIGAFELAASRAVSLNQICRFRLDRRAGRFQLEEAGGPGLRGNGFVPVRDLAGSDGELDERITLVFHPAAEESTPRTGEEDRLVRSQAATAPGLTAITFFADGTCEGGSLELRDSEGFGLLLKLNPVTARVQVIELGRQSAPAPQPETALQ